MHVTHQRSLLTSYVPFDDVSVHVANNSKEKVHGMGTVKLFANVAGANVVLTLKNVFYIPCMPYNIVSLHKILQMGLKAVFQPSSCIFTQSIDHIVVAEAHEENGFYVVDCYAPSPDKMHGVMMINSQNYILRLWHQRLGHAGQHAIFNLANKNLVDGMARIPASSTLGNCRGCDLGKQARKAFHRRTSEARTTRPLELVHSDLCGPMSTQSLGGGLYFMTFVDDCTRKAWVYILKLKSEAFQYFQQFKHAVELESGHKLCTLRSDGGGEYMSNAFRRFCVDAGIKHQVTLPYTPQQNGVAERLNRTIMECTRAMLYAQDLPEHFWGEAVTAAVYLKNRLPHITLGYKVPEHSWTGKKPDVRNLRVWGCKAYVHIPSSLRKKLDAKSRICIFVGYANEHMGWRFWDVEGRKIIFSRDATFWENSLGIHAIEDEADDRSMDGDSEDEVCSPANQQDESPSAVFEEKPRANTDSCRQNEQPPTELEPDEFGIISLDHLDAPMEEDQPSNATAPVPAETPPPPPLAREQRTRKRPVMYGRDEYIATRSVYVLLTDPLTTKEALSRSDAIHWHRAMEEELASLHENKTWELVELPRERRAIPCKWVFKTKRNADGSIERYKARLVAKGYSQKEGIDYSETFSPTLIHTSIRTLLALAAAHDWEVHQVDVATAFLNGTLEEEVYMQQPPEFIKSGEEHLVCKLIKSLYGLKQAGRVWNEEINAFLCSVGFHRSLADPCIYVRRNDPTNIIGMHVDDECITGSNMEVIERTKEELSAKYKIKDLGPAKFLLGWEITRNREAKTISI